MLEDIPVVIVCGGQSTRMRAGNVDLQLMIYRHTGFWQSMNSFKDTMELESAWQQDPPWKIWTE